MGAAGSERGPGTHVPHLNHALCSTCEHRCHPPTLSVRVAPAARSRHAGHGMRGTFTCPYSHAHCLQQAVLARSRAPTHSNIIAHNTHAHKRHTRTCTHAHTQHSTHLKPARARQWAQTRGSQPPGHARAGWRAPGTAPAGPTRRCGARVRPSQRWPAQGGRASQGGDLNPKVT